MKHSDCGTAVAGFQMRPRLTGGSVQDCRQAGFLINFIAASESSLPAVLDFTLLSQSFYRQACHAVFLQCLDEKNLIYSPHRVDFVSESYTRTYCMYASYLSSALIQVFTSHLCYSPQAHCYYAITLGTILIIPRLLVTLIHHTILLQDIEA